MNRVEYNHNNLEGNDVSIEISLKEYGLAWIETDTEFMLYYGIKHDGNEYIRFDFCSFSKDMDVKKDFDWVNFEDVESYTGMSFNDMTFTQQISDLFAYYGHENVFGSSYWGGLTYDEICIKKG